MKTKVLLAVSGCMSAFLLSGCMGLGVGVESGFGYDGPYWGIDDGYYGPIYSPSYGPPAPPLYGGGFYPSPPPPARPQPPTYIPSAPSSPGSSSTHRPAAPVAPGGYERPGNNGLPSATTPGASTPRGRTR